MTIDAAITDFKSAMEQSRKEVLALESALGELPDEIQQRLTNFRNNVLESSDTSFLVFDDINIRESDLPFEFVDEFDDQLDKIFNLIELIEERVPDLEVEITNLLEDAIDFEKGIQDGETLIKDRLKATLDGVNESFLPLEHVLTESMLGLHKRCKETNTNIKSRVSKFVLDSLQSEITTKIDLVKDQLRLSLRQSFSITDQIGDELDNYIGDLGRDIENKFEQAGLEILADIRETLLELLTNKIKQEAVEAVNQALLGAQITAALQPHLLSITIANQVAPKIQDLLNAMRAGG